MPNNLHVFVEAELKAKAVANMRLALKFKTKPEMLSFCLFQVKGPM